MNIGIFTDTYYPQVTGVASSIKNLKTELTKLGHQVYIFTTTDPRANSNNEDKIIRLPSIPFISFKDRRIVVRGMIDAYLVARKLKLDLIHTQTEFGMGVLGKLTSLKLKIPHLHTWHTNYEDYLHYIAKGRVIRPVHVKMLAKLLFGKADAIVCPSVMVAKMLHSYGFKIPLRIIPTGIAIDQFTEVELSYSKRHQLRMKLEINDDDLLFLSLSRLSYEKNVQSILNGMPEILARYPNAQLVIVGDGPYRSKLEHLAQTLGISARVHFVGMVSHEETAYYYKLADYFVNASTSETQGLTYLEALASGLQCIVQGNEYLESVFDQEIFGRLFYGDNNFARATISYVANAPSGSEVQWDQKRYEISAEKFGRSMNQFYLEVIDSYQQKMGTRKLFRHFQGRFRIRKQR